MNHSQLALDDRLHVMLILLFIVVISISIFGTMYSQIKPVTISVKQHGGNIDLITNLKFTSDDEKINKTASEAGLESKSSWRGNAAQKFLTYLQIELDDLYKLDGIITKGNTNLKEWVTQFYIEYWDKYQETWVKYNQIINANINDNQPVNNKLDILTDKIKIFPIDWKNNPSLRVGLIGIKQAFSKCRLYKSKMASKNPIDVKYYTKLYNKKCLKVPKETFDSVVTDLRKNQQQLCANEEKMINLNRTLQGLEKKKQMLDELQKKCNTITQELKHLKATSCPKAQLLDLADKFRKIAERKTLLNK